MKKVLITSRHFLNVISEFENLFKAHNIKFDYIKGTQFVEKEKILKIIHKYDGLICSDDIIDKDVLNKAKKLKVISKWGMGIDSIDKKTAKKCGIKVKNCKGVFIESTSNYVIAMILNITRFVNLSNNAILNHNWKKFSGFEIKNKTIGIVGAGKIGKSIIKKISSFGMKIIINDIKKINSNFLKKYKIKQCHLNYLLNNSDIITLNTDLNETSRNLFDYDKFLKMKKKPIFINCSRGGLVVQKDLFKALDKKIISAVGIDVFELEPPSKKINFAKYKTSIFSCHNAYNTMSAVKKTHEMVFNNLIKNI